MMMPYVLSTLSVSDLKNRHGLIPARQALQHYIPDKHNLRYHPTYHPYRRALGYYRQPLVLYY